MPFRWISREQSRGVYGDVSRPTRRYARVDAGLKSRSGRSFPTNALVSVVALLPFVAPFGATAARVAGNGNSCAPIQTASNSCRGLSIFAGARSSNL
jgi:hypothetical protein